MILQDLLIRNMVQYMLSIFGLADYQVFDTIGIMKNEFRALEVIKIQYDIGPVENNPIFSASTIFNNSKLHVAGCFIGDEDGAFYMVVFKLDDFNTYAFKINLSDQQENAIFIVSKAKGSWSKISMYDKIIACAGLEKLNDAGIIWKAEPLGEFYNQLVELAEM